VNEVGNLGQPWEHHHLVEPREIGQNLNTKWIDGSKYISEIHKMLAEVMCRLIFSGKSKLEAIAFDGAIDPHPVPHSSVEHHLGPEDRIFLNDIYTSTASTLEIESMPTILLQIMKKFGYEAKSCFVLSLLLIFGNSRNDKEILRFLTICHTSAIGPFLWISSGKESYQEEIWKFLRISEVVEHVLRCEDPRLLTMLHSSGISVFSLVERWYSQNFWGILPWKEILCYQLMVFIYGVDFIVYMAVALIHHLEPTLKQAITSRRPAKDLLLTDCYTSFGLGSWRKMIIQLRIEYHEVIMKTMKVTEKKKV
jgi:hypothetical protein